MPFSKIKITYLIHMKQVCWKLVKTSLCEEYRAFHAERLERQFKLWQFTYFCSMGKPHNGWLWKAWSTLDRIVYTHWLTSPGQANNARKGIQGRPYKVGTLQEGRWTALQGIWRQKWHMPGRQDQWIMVGLQHKLVNGMIYCCMGFFIPYCSLYHFPLPPLLKSIDPSLATR